MAVSHTWTVPCDSCQVSGGEGSELSARDWAEGERWWEREVCIGRLLFTQVSLSKVMNANCDGRKCRSFSSNPNKTNWTEICPMMVSEQIKLNSLCEERAKLKIKPDHFLSLYDTRSSAIRHCWSIVLEKLLRVWGKTSAWIIGWCFSSGSLSLILYKEVVFQNYICVANLTTSSWLGITALSSAHPSPHPALTLLGQAEWQLEYWVLA